MSYQRSCSLLKKGLAFYIEKPVMTIREQSSRFSIRLRGRELTFKCTYEGGKQCMV